MFKFVDEESDDYFKSVKDEEQYMGGDNDAAGEWSMGKKIGVGVALLAVVGLVVFLTTKGGAAEGDATTTDADADTGGDGGDAGGDGGDGGEAGGDGGDGGSGDTS